MRASRLPPVPLVVLVVAVLLLALSLTWHLAGMDHGADMGLLGACVAILAAGLAMLFPTRTWWPVRIAPSVRASASAVEPPALAGRPRPLPREGTVLRR